MRRARRSVSAMTREALEGRPTDVGLGLWAEVVTLAGVLWAASPGLAPILTVGIGHDFELLWRCEIEQGRVVRFMRTATSTSRPAGPEWANWPDTIAVGITPLPCGRPRVPHPLVTISYDMGRTSEPAKYVRLPSFIAYECGPDEVEHAIASAIGASMVGLPWVESAVMAGEAADA